MTKWVLPLMALIQVATSVALLCASIGQKSFSADRCTVSLMELIERYTTQEVTLDDLAASHISNRNAVDPNYILGVACNFITYIMCVGSAIAGVEVKTLNGLLTLREKSRNFSSDMKQLASGVLLDMFGYDVEVATSVSSLIQDLVARAGEMTRTPELTFLTDATKTTELAQLLKEIEKLQTAKMSEAQQRAYNQARTTLNHQYQALSKTYMNIQALAKNNDRPVTVGIVLNGDPGIGKSNFAKYVMRRVAKVMGYSPAIYNMEMGPNGSYAEIYKREALGIYNEFAKTKKNEHAIYNINSIVSDDPVNLEAADCNYKIQPCVLRLVALTVNRDNLFFREELNETANVALITRMIEVDIEDDLFQGRGQPNLHRRGDYSHLRVKWKKLKNTRPLRLDDTKERHNVSLSSEEFIKLLISHLATNEIHFLENQLAEGTAIDVSMTAAVRARILQLQLMHNPEPNARGCNTSFFVARWQGPRGYGKTTQAQTFASLMEKSFKMKTHYIKDPSFTDVPRGDAPATFILDDLPITPSNAQAYHLWINAIPKNSIVVIITNDVVPPESITRFSRRHLATCMNAPTLYSLDWHEMWETGKSFAREPSIKAFHLDNYPKVREVLNVAPGLSRRLGFAGLQVVDNEYVDPPPESGICLTVGQQDHINLRPSGPIDLAFETARAFIQYIRSSEAILTVHQTPPSATWDIWIEVRDFELFKVAAGSEIGYYRMFMQQQDPAGRIHINQASIQRMLSVTDVASWVIPNIGESDQIFPVAERCIHKLVNAFPDVVIRITCGGRQLFYHKSIIYDTMEMDQDCISVRDGCVYVNGKALLPTVVAQLKVNGIKSGRPFDIPDMPPNDLVFALSYIEKNKHLPELSLYNEAVEQLVDRMKQAQTLQDHPVYTWLMTNSFSRNVLLGSLAAVTTIGAAYGLYKLCVATQDEDMTDTPIRNQDPSGKADDYHGKSKDNRARMQDRARGPARAKYSWSRNADSASTPTMPNRAQDFAGMSREELLETCQRLTTPNGNMVKGELANANNPRLAAIISRLQRNVCRVSTTNGLCHGLLMTGRYVITVKHIVYDCENVSVIWAPSTSTQERLYNARVVSTDHARDLAILEVTDPLFPEAVNITSYIVHSDLMDTWRSDALYIRPLATVEIVHGQAYHSDRYRTPLGVASDPSWNPTKYYDFTPIHMGVGSRHVRKGDCGLPLMREIEGNYYILGLNCAVTLLGEANFSMISRETLSSMLDNQSVANALKPCDMNMQLSTIDPSCISVPDYNPFVENISDRTKYDNQPEMEVLGYASQLALVSNPKHCRTLSVPIDCPIQTKSGRSLLKDTEVPPSAINTMPKDVSGRPSIHLTQAIKNFRRMEFKMTDDEFEENAFITANYLASRLGDDMKMLRTHEVINGIIGEPLRGMPQGTSAGPYMKVKYRITNKRDLFRVTSKEGAPQVLGFADTPAATDLAQQFNAMCHLIEQGEVPLFVVKDNLKVELLPLEKIQNGESRVFCECDLAVNMVLRRYTGAFAAALVENHPFLGIATGMNPYLFPTFTHKHTPTCYNTICTDLKRMDKTLHPSFIYLYFLCIKACYRKGNTVEDESWEALTKMLSSTIHIFNGILYSVEGGNPSGMFGTGQLNSVVILFVIIKEFRRVQANIGLRVFSPTYFDASVKKEILGDDMRIRVLPSLGITFESMRTAFAECGLECVPSKTPGGELGDFCSRAYYWDKDEQVIYPCLKEDTIIDLVLWVHPTEPEVMIANFSMAMFEASLRDESFFKKIVKAVKLQLDKLTLPEIPFFTYKQHRKHFAKYVRGEEASPMLTDIGPNIVFDYTIDESPIIRQMDYVGALLALYAQNKTEFDGTFNSVRNTTTGNWEFTLSLGGTSYVGSGTKKASAKNDAFRQAYVVKNDEMPQRNAANTGPWHKHSLRYRTEPSSSGVHRILAVYLDDKRLCELSGYPDRITEQTPESCVRAIIDRHIEHTLGRKSRVHNDIILHESYCDGQHITAHDSFSSLNRLSPLSSSVEDFIGQNAPSDTTTEDEEEEEDSEFEYQPLMAGHE